MASQPDEMRQRYASMSTEELFAIAHTDREQYRPEAVALALEEMTRRNIPAEGPADLILEAEAEQREVRERELKPLPLGLKALCVALPGVPALIIYTVLIRSGRKRAAREAAVCLAVGIVVWWAAVRLLT